MTRAERPHDHSEAVNYFLKFYGKSLEVQGFKLTRCYDIDFHELLSRTAVTILEKWLDDFCMLTENERNKLARRILLNHARNLSRSARRNESKLVLVASDELEGLTCAISSHEDPVAVNAIFQDEQFEIYGAISRLDGRCRDVMALIALGLEDSEIRDVLRMSGTNLTSTKARARKLLLQILSLEEKEGRGRCRGGIR
jgi:DNA-directed RNA polymerase specialized sigma24 family protein